MWGACTPFRYRYNPKNEALVPAPCQSKLGPLTESYLQHVPTQRIVPEGQHVVRILDVRQV